MNHLLPPQTDRARARGRRISRGVLALVVCTFSVVTACSAKSTPAPIISPMSSMAGATTEPVAVCDQRPKPGEVASDDNPEFHSGRAHVVLKEPDQQACLTFPHWGNASPSVPTDSLLFVFKDDGSDGLTIEIPARSLTQSRTVNGQVDLVVNGAHYIAVTCVVTVTAYSNARAAGSFSCPSAASSATNPFFPNDDVGTDEKNQNATPTTTAQEQSISLSGWFELES